MAKQTCKSCGRPLTEEDSDDYCPHCNAERAEKMRGIIGAIGGTVVAVAGVIIAVIGIFGKGKK